METNETTETNKQTFRQYVEKRLSFADFNKLPELLGLTIRKTTTVLKYPPKMDYATILKLGEVMGEDLTKLIDQFEIGYDRLTVNKHKKLTMQD